MFIDEARIYVNGGDGGAGAVSFRREKHVPRGGPNGGNGGYGGSVIFEVDEGLKTLQDFKYKRHFEGGRGSHGGGNHKNGPNGKDLILKVAPGTLIKDDEGRVIFDLTKKGQHYVAVSGGHGGKGNAYFSTSTRKVPGFAQKGEPGQGLWLILELKMLADVGIVGLPNVGKSTFISVVSAAKPKIADYPFTTLVPNLGVVETDSFSYVVADIPGLIEGAHRGAGLGDAFLRHIDRAGLILHMIDLSSEEPLRDFEIVEKELRLYSEDLARRTQVVVGNKTDVLSGEAAQATVKKVASFFGSRNLSFFAISAYTKKGLGPLLAFLGQKVKETKLSTQVIEKESVITYKMAAQKLSDFEVIKEAPGIFRISGKAIERFVIMTDLENEEALDFLKNKFKAIKLDSSLFKAGAREGDLVKIGSYEFHFQP